MLPLGNFARVFYQDRLGVSKASSALSRGIGNGQGSFGVVFAQGSLKSLSMVSDSHSVEGEIGMERLVIELVIPRNHTATRLCIKVSSYSPCWP